MTYSFHGAQKQATRRETNLRRNEKIFSNFSHILVWRGAELSEVVHPQKRLLNHPLVSLRDAETRKLPDADVCYALLLLHKFHQSCEPTHRRRWLSLPDLSARPIFSRMK
ncbi:hypothetical protein PUN28_004829 [Cardiocondyla obscurior]|uniref:Uncharacterized protein n=1 Tax=Cardiocondyla obscurior TaxID=286306 RepID=A0AAW2GHS0_9HYME